jgi:hypothetical protein
MAKKFTVYDIPVSTEDVDGFRPYSSEYFKTEADLLSTMNYLLKYSGRPIREDHRAEPAFIIKVGYGGGRRVVQIGWYKK